MKTDTHSTCYLMWAAQYIRPMRWRRDFVWFEGCLSLCTLLGCQMMMRGSGDWYTAGGPARCFHTGAGVSAHGQSYKSSRFDQIFGTSLPTIAAMTNLVKNVASHITKQVVSSSSSSGNNTTFPY